MQLHQLLSLKGWSSENKLVNTCTFWRAEYFHVLVTLRNDDTIKQAYIIHLSILVYVIFTKSVKGQTD